MLNIFVVFLQANQSKVDDFYSQVQATYELVLEYGIQVPAMDMAAYHTLTADMNALQQAVEDIEARQEDQTEAFGRELATGQNSLLDKQQCMGMASICIIMFMLPSSFWTAGRACRASSQLCVHSC